MTAAPSDKNKRRTNLRPKPRAGDSAIDAVASGEAGYAELFDPVPEKISSGSGVFDGVSGGIDGIEDMTFLGKLETSPLGKLETSRGGRGGIAGMVGIMRGAGVGAGVGVGVGGRGGTSDGAGGTAGTGRGGGNGGGGEGGAGVGGAGGIDETSRCDAGRTAGTGADGAGRMGFGATGAITGVGRGAAGGVGGTLPLIGKLVGAPETWLVGSNKAIVH